MVPSGDLIFLIEESEAVSLCTDATLKPASSPVGYRWYFTSFHHVHFSPGGK